MPTLITSSLFVDVSIRIADILRLITANDDSVCYPKVETDGNVLWFPIYLNPVNLPFWFVLPAETDNKKAKSVEGFDQIETLFRIMLFQSETDTQWPSEDVRKCVQSMGNVLSSWSMYVDDNLGYDDGTNVLDPLFTVQQVGGINWDRGVSGLSASPLEHYQEEYVGLIGSVIIMITNIQEGSDSYVCP